MLTKQELDEIRARVAITESSGYWYYQQDVPRLLDEIERLRENLRKVEPYCCEPALAVVEDRYTWTAERCSVCSAEFVQGYGTHKKNCPFYEET